MIKTTLIKILFWLLKVDFKTKDLVPFEDLRHIAGEEKATLVKESFRRQKYIQALAGAYHVPNFTEWLYLQVVTKRNEHIKTIDKDKRNAQRDAMLTFLMMIEEMRNANDELAKANKKRR